MKLDVRSVTWAAECAESLLAPLGDRWLHVQGVVERACWVGEMFDNVRMARGQSLIVKTVDG